MSRQKPWHWHKVGTLPTISDIVVHDVSSVSCGVQFDVDIPSQGQIEYGATTAYGSLSGRSTAYATTHDITITGLSEGTLHVRVLAIGRDGTTRSADFEVEVTAAGTTPTISAINVHTITETSANVEWNVAPDSTGQVFWGTVAGVAPDDFPYHSVREATVYPYHNQTIGAADDPANPAMTAGTTYYYQIESSDATGRTAISSVGTFDTAGSGEAVASILGGIGARMLANTRIGYSGILHGSQAFRAERSLAVSTARMFWQGGGGYSAGDGGTYTASIFPDNGSGQPDLNATPLAQTTGITPGGTSIGQLTTFVGGSVLTSGSLYHFVMENTHGDPTNNYSSMNSVYSPVAGFARWASALEHRFQYRQSGAWNIRSGYVICHEITYSDGHGQGQGYMEMSYPTVPSAVAHVQASGTRMVRQVFVPTANTSAIGAGIMVQKASGVTDALTIALRDDGAGRGTLLASFTVAAADIPTGPMSGSDLASTATWEGDVFSAPEALTAATTYRLEFSTSGAGEFMAWPLRQGTAWSYTDDVLWPGGHAQYSTNDGSTWTNIDGSNDDLPAYVRLT